MQIVLTFNSFEELQQELYRWTKATMTGKLDPAPAKDPIAAETSAEAEKAQKVVQFEKKAEPEIMPEPTTEPEPNPAQEPAPQVDESYRVEVRKQLAKLNKKTGENTASKLIKGFGVDKLTEVALKDLPKLMRQAEEALNA